MNVFEFAVNMEKDGEKYYLEQAERNGDNPLAVVFRRLAADETKHAQVIRDKIDGKPYELKNEDDLSAEMDLFLHEKDFQSSVKELPDQVELYHTALEKEQQSIDLYTDLLAKAEDETERRLFAFLVQEEQKHHSILEEMYRYVNRPNEWVESAEFGIREEY